jgi:mannose-1-phosphate guanylyltransferase
VEAVVLVGGQGTRLRPLTLATPKPMLRAAGAPFLAHQLARARAAGVEHVVLATSYRAEVFASYFGDGSGLGLRIDYVTEVEPLGTGGAIRNVASRLESAPGDPVVILNGDVLSGHDLGAQVAAHRAAAAAVTLHLVHVADPRPFGSVPTDAQGRVVAFVEKSPEPVSDQVNAGCYVFDRAVIDAITPDTVVSVERDTFPRLLADGAVVLGHVADGYWLDVGTPAAFVRASADLVQGALDSPLVAAAREAMVAESALVDGTATVGEGSFVDDDAVVGPGSRVDGSILGRGARVGAGCTLLRSVLGPGAVLGNGCVVTDAVVGDGAVVGARNELLAGARVWSGVTLADSAVRFSSDA